ncbi:MAG: hypothetical protein KC777_26500 [Cyanobacteria bacterium HKST-UBA02]|nr:hypothetical protein [Cyanobacteria bacterium HKST-UBA02]
MVELLVASAMLVFVTAVLAELMHLAVLSTEKLSSQMDGRSAAAFAIERIQKDVRMAKHIEIQDQHTLKLLVPFFYLSPENDPKSPLYNALAEENEANGMLIPGSEEVTYTIGESPDAPGTFNLAMSRQSGPFQTILTGIVGPTISGSDIPAIFSAFSTNESGKNLYGITSGPYVDGIRVDLEVKRPVGTQSTSESVKYTASHGESFIRANSSQYAWGSNE